jgi:hypothetical protein
LELLKLPFFMLFGVFYTIYSDFLTFMVIFLHFC